MTKCRQWLGLLLAFMLMLTVMPGFAGAADVQLAEDDDFAADEAGHYYVNMPKTGENSLSLDGTITAFKVYDDGGKKRELQQFRRRLSHDHRTGRISDARFRHG